jgi:hypothetical protein
VLKNMIVTDQGSRPRGGLCAAASRALVGAASAAMLLHAAGCEKAPEGSSAGAAPTSSGAAASTAAQSPTKPAGAAATTASADAPKVDPARAKLGKKLPEVTQEDLKRSLEAAGWTYGGSGETTSGDNVMRTIGISRDELKGTIGWYKTSDLAFTKKAFVKDWPSVEEGGVLLTVKMDDETRKAEAKALLEMMVSSPASP